MSVMIPDHDGDAKIMYVDVNDNNHGGLHEQELRGIMNQELFLVYRGIANYLKQQNYHWDIV